MFCTVARLTPLKMATSRCVSPRLTRRRRSAAAVGLIVFVIMHSASGQSAAPNASKTQNGRPAFESTPLGRQVLHLAALAELERDDDGRPLSRDAQVVFVGLGLARGRWLREKLVPRHPPRGAGHLDAAWFRAEPSAQSWPVPPREAVAGARERLGPFGLTDGRIARLLTCLANADDERRLLETGHFALRGRWPSADELDRYHRELRAFLADLAPARRRLERYRAAGLVLAATAALEPNQSHPDAERITEAVLAAIGAVAADPALRAAYAVLT